MGVATLRILRDNFTDVVGTLARLGVHFLGSCESQYPYIHLVVEGECVPDANLVVATIQTERTPESHRVSISFEQIEGSLNHEKAA